MDGTLVLGKTRKGVEEVAARSGAVAQKLRSVLILVDGKTPVAELLRKCSFIPECGQHLVWLVQHGFVEAVGSVPGAALVQPAVATSARKALQDLAQEVLGKHATAVVQRLQDTDDTRAALTQTLERCHKLIRLSIDEGKAEQFHQQGLHLLTAWPET